MKLIIALLGLTVSLSATAQYATWYGGKFHGRLTASGERFDQNALTCASNKYKLGTKLIVTNHENGKSVTCRVNDRGGFGKYGVSLDLSKVAFTKISPLSKGKIKVTIVPIN